MTSRFPYPPIKGDKYIPFYRGTALKKKNITVDLLSLAYESDLIHITKLESIFNNIFTVKRTIIKFLLNLVKGIYIQRPLQVLFFENNKLNGRAVHTSLFELEKLKKYISQVKGKKIVFLFKTLDSLEMLEKDYSKKLLKKIVPLVDKVVVSFATRSMISRKKFSVSRKWILDFISNEFKVLDDFEVGGERYVVFKK